MPIKGLTDRKTPSFPKIGDIRKGAEKTDPKRPGKDLTYFRYIPLEGEETAAEKFHQVYGDEPREINVFLPFDSIERNFEAFMERHTASALQCRGDGETAFLWRDAKSGMMQHTPKPCPSPHCTGCKEVGRLKIIVPELQRLAYIVVHTTSKWDIIELTANLEAIRKLTGNGLKGIPLILKRRPRTVSTPRAKGKRVRQEKWLLSIEADPQWVKAQLEAMKIAALPALPSPAPIEEGETVESKWDDELFEAGEIETASNDLTDVQLTAYNYVTPSGLKLGSQSFSELSGMLDWANDNPSKQGAKILKRHCETLIDYIKQSKIVEVVEETNENDDAKDTD